VVVTISGGANNSKMSSSSGDQGRKSSDSCRPTSSDSKAQSAWHTVKSNFKARSSMPNLHRWFSSSRASDTRTVEEYCRLTDEQEGVFCESLLGLMERTGRYDYVDFTKDNVNESQQDSPNEEGRGKKAKDRAKRFSWSR